MYVYVFVCLSSDCNDDTFPILETSNVDMIKPFLQNLVPGILPQPERKCDYNLGDVLLGMPEIQDRCRQDGVLLHDRLPVCGVINYWRLMYRCPDFTLSLSFISILKLKLKG